MTPPAPATEPPRRGLEWLLLAGIAVATAALRWRLLDIPLERDEGEYAYAAQLLLRGIPPYADAYTMKLPGTIAAYAGILAVGGESAAAIHAGLLVANLVTLVLVFLLARRFLASEAALGAAAAFGLLSLSRGLLGFTANSEHFVILPAVGALVCLLRALERDRLAAFAGAGALLGIALLMKQHALFFLAFAALWTVLDGWRGRETPWRRLLQRVAILLGGAAFPVALSAVAIAAAGAFDELWFWTVTYPQSYLDQVTLARGLELLWLQVSGNAAIFTTVWILAAMGLVTLCTRREPRRPRFLGLFALFSFASVWPGLFFRGHYFLLLVPAAALLAGAAIEALPGWLGARVTPRTARVVTRIAVALCFAAAVVQERAYLFQHAPGEILRAAYGQQGFEESVAIAQYVRERTAADDRIGVFGSEPQIYFYAGRRAITGYIYMYPLLENQPLAGRMQVEVIEDFETELPPFVVATANHRSWLPRPGVPRTILEWIPAFLDLHYDRVAFTDVAADGSPIYAFDSDAEAREPTIPDGLQIYRRKR